MKNIFTFFLLIAVSTAKAQYFKVTQKGLMNQAEDKSFAVLEFPNQSKTDLYAKAVKYIHKAYKNPDEVIKSDLKDESIRFISYKDDMKVSNGGVKVPVEIKYAIQLEFKDGKIKYEIVDQNFGMLTYTGNIWKSYPMWNEKNGKLRLEEEKNQLESHFNTEAQLLVNYINGKSETNNGW